MSLLIKNWQMADWKELLKWAKIGANNAMIGEFTEIEEVPPHGRLIDADALKLSHCKECTLYPDKCLEKTDEGCDWESIYHIEHCAPTIIPAEEGET